MNLTVIVPAFNETDYLPATLDAIESAATHVRARFDAEVDTIVVDNNSTDDTRRRTEQGRNGRARSRCRASRGARNAGAHHAHGDVLVFVDADTLVPPTLLEAIRDTMSDPACVGGGVDVESQPRRRFTRLYLRGWRVLARRMALVQGATQFCRRDVLEQVGGHDEQAWIARTSISTGPFSGGPGRAAARCGSSEQASRAGVLSPLRQVAAVEDAALDEPALHRAVPPPQGVLDRLVPASGAVGCRAGVTLPRNTPCARPV